MISCKHNLTHDVEHANFQASLSFCQAKTADMTAAAAQSAKMERAIRCKDAGSRCDI